jgi:hypothetical protein
MHNGVCRRCAEACCQSATVCDIALEESVEVNSSVRGEKANSFLPFSFWGIGFALRDSLADSRGNGLVDTRNTQFNRLSEGRKDYIRLKRYASLRHCGKIKLKTSAVRYLSC